MKPYVEKRVEKRSGDSKFTKEWENTSKEFEKISNDIRLDILLSKLKEENRVEEIDFGISGKELI